ncbi:DUF3325 domain-containing protein [Altericroceibacterium spongiae]|uniref:DUF3325 domain-containing protein n=1 Tax=Altericroceibacterium spongiae TaxID=2320269 RepID=A0A420EE55_9SPHN|nr:DUF3325 domain-containing protein [Altericroceibacterium spongiae]RKF18950.1 DUF3325 domain-containing protein [Altericroceibacterium spongiae]
MQDTLLLFAAFVLATLGFALLALSQKQHWRRLRPHISTGPPRWLRPAGWVLPGLAAVPVLIRDGLAFGLLLWAGLLTVSAILIVGAVLVLDKRAGKSDMETRDASLTER